MLLTVIPASLAIDLGGHSGYGYGSQEACIEGYDKDCGGVVTPAVVPDGETPVPSVAPVVPNPTPVPADESAGPGPTLEPKDCKLVIPQECVFPFVYKSISYTTCTGVDTLNGGLWCSTMAKYEGGWKQCTDPCKNKWPAKAIISSVVAGGVAVTGIGLIAAAVIPNNPVHGFFNQKNGNGATGPTPPPAVVEVAVTRKPAGPAVLAPAPTPAPGVVMVKVPLPAPSRLFMETQKPGVVAKMQAEGNGALILGGVGFAVIFLVLAVIFGIRSKKVSTRRLASASLVETDQEPEE
jgi:hypothetical protein